MTHHYGAKLGAAAHRARALRFRFVVLLPSPLPYGRLLAPCALSHPLVVHSSECLARQAVKKQTFNWPNPEPSTYLPRAWPREHLYRASYCTIPPACGNYPWTMAHGIGCRHTGIPPCGWPSRFSRISRRADYGRTAAVELRYMPGTCIHVSSSMHVAVRVAFAVTLTVRNKCFTALSHSLAGYSRLQYCKRAIMPIFGRSHHEPRLQGP